jgi:hypothetical protein
MSNYYRKSRNVQKSIKRYLDTCFTADWSGVTTTLVYDDAYKTSISLPIIVIEMISKEESRAELGSNSMFETFSVDINIFGKSRGITWDLVDYITSKLKLGFPYYTFANDPDDKSTLDATDSGTRVGFVKFISNYPLTTVGEPHVRDKFRHKLVVSLEKHF